MSRNLPAFDLAAVGDESLSILARGLVGPEVLRIARRTMRVVKLNIAFTTVYNMVGLSLAAFGLLPPIFAAAAQSLPDLGILANSSRLLRQK